MKLDEIPNIEVLAGGTAGLSFLLVIGKKLWRLLSSEATETRKDRAEATIYNNLQGEITRMGDDIRELKDAHRADEKLWKERIAALETEISSLNRVLAEIKVCVVEALEKVTECDSNCQEKSIMSAKLKQILTKQRNCHVSQQPTTIF
ncbi:MAG: hypothetical protein EPN21_13235 [Methylococcaceae bacterium]|nr:MAG: hypothetical protein EPN21_13235 [Methylococcaceae bacterium]